MNLDSTTHTAVSPDGCTITAVIHGAEHGATSTLSISDGTLQLSCLLGAPLLAALENPPALAARLMRAAGCQPDSSSCALSAKQATLHCRRRGEISREEADFLFREAIGLIEEAADQDELPDALMERFWGKDWQQQIPRLPHSTRQRVELMVHTLSNALKECSA